MWYNWHSQTRCWLWKERNQILVTWQKLTNILVTTLTLFDEWMVFTEFHWNITIIVNSYYTKCCPWSMPLTSSTQSRASSQHTGELLLYIFLNFMLTVLLDNSSTSILHTLLLGSTFSYFQNLFTFISSLINHPSALGPAILFTLIDSFSKSHKIF